MISRNDLLKSFFENEEDFKSFVGGVDLEELKIGFGEANSTNVIELEALKKLIYSYTEERATISILKDVNTLIKRMNTECKS